MKPTVILDEGRVRLYLGDCLEVLPTFPKGKIDAVVTDPPYGIGFNYESHDDTKEVWRRLMQFLVGWVRTNDVPAVMPCIKLGRRFVGIEKEPKYFEIAVRRITDAIAKRNSSFQVATRPPQPVPTFGIGTSKKGKE